MTDTRYKTLASLLVNYSTALKKGERVLLDMIDVPDEFTIELMRAARKVGAIPLVEIRHTRVNREVVRDTNEKHAALVRDLELARMKKVEAYIAIRGSENANENSDVPSERMSLYSRVTRPVLNYRVNKTRWCVLRWPTPSMAQSTSSMLALVWEVGPATCGQTTPGGGDTNIVALSLPLIWET